MARIGDERLSKLEKSLRVSVYPLLLPASLDAAIRPAILHGDLWSGNAGVDANLGTPVIYDPSSFYGHGEAELGMMHMFGGFTRECFDAYHDVVPKSEPYYEERMQLYQLYHQLNHALLFGGGGYQLAAQGIMSGLTAWAEKETASSRKSEL